MPLLQFWHRAPRTLIVFPVLVVQDSCRPPATAPAEPTVNPSEQLELDASDPEVPLTAGHVIAVFADRPPARATVVRELALSFLMTARPASHSCPLSCWRQSRRRARRIALQCDMSRKLRRDTREGVGRRRAGHQARPPARVRASASRCCAVCFRMSAR